MPLFYTEEINETTKLAIWKIEEPESFFLGFVPLQNNITHPHKRLQHLAGRYLLQYLYPDFPIHSIQVASTRKPFLQEEQYHFSISHCGNYAAAIVSPTQRIGIDIEIKRPTIVKIAHKFLHEDEIKQLSLGVEDTESALENNLDKLTVIWCAKEAIFKWWGLGEVDFSEMIRVDGFGLFDEGKLSVEFIKGPSKLELSPTYKIFDAITLVKVIGNIE